MNEALRDKAEPIAEEITQKVAFYIRYKLEKWPRASDFAEMKRNIKSIIVQHLSKQGDSP